MRLWLVIFLGLLVSACSHPPTANQSSTQVARADVFIQAGHEGRSSGKMGSTSQFGREIDWTPVVADAATHYLRQAGFSVIRADANWKQKTDTDLALFIHFDGSANPCATGASIGYDDPSDRPAANAWKRLYSQYFRYRWQQDNFTKNLSQYYMFKHTRTRDAELVLELGAIGCPEQALWLRPRLPQLGQLVAHFAAERMGYGNRIPRPQM
ncbi:MAG: Unknown protein [uncultured Thiotrichaceae bacterium]|uniref:MurNAc-LAA domain-containing protein n=1 Tax=uncultured Thiotrichaceae bacterium TaxID=298394 RepID=A0A6S6TP67_9GAMM|nr:MAG: Unknown protein [uncultured Thiotrichaceae bacterium]